MTVGPFFGVRYQPPRVEIPVVTTPATEDDEPALYAREPDGDGARGGSGGEDRSDRGGGGAGGERGHGGDRGQGGDRSDGVTL